MNIIVTDRTLYSLSLPGGQHLSFREKARIAETLSGLGMDALEMEKLHEVRDGEIIGATLCSLIGDTAAAIPVSSPDEAEAAFRCVKDARHPRLQVVLPVSTVQMEYLFHRKEEQMLSLIRETAAAAVKVCTDVEFTALDASRAEKGFLRQALETALEAGCRILTVCDDAGILTPREWADMIRSLPRGNAKLLAQPSDSLHMAAACAVEALQAGADGVKTTLTGEDILSSLTLLEVLHKKGEDLQLFSGLDVTRFRRAVENLLHPQASAETLYQEDESISLDGSATLTDLNLAAQKLGYTLSAEDLGNVYGEFQRIMRSKDLLGARELDAVIASASAQVPSTYRVVHYAVSSGSAMAAMAQITLERGGENLLGIGSGDGPIDAAFKAIENIIGHHYELDEFRIQAITEGREALGSSVIRLRDSGRLYAGTAVSPDIVGACIMAYVNTLNKIVYEEEQGA